MLITQLNSVVAALNNIDTVSLHTGNPGNIGANESDYDRETLTWSTPSGGLMKATATFPGVVGTFTHVGLWDGETFITSKVFNVTLPDEQDLLVLVELAVGVKL